MLRICDEAWRCGEDGLDVSRAVRVGDVCRCGDDALEHVDGDDKSSSHRIWRTGLEFSIASMLAGLPVPGVCVLCVCVCICMCI